MQLHDAQYEEWAELLKVLAHPVRLCIVKGLRENGGCTVSHMQHCLDMPQSTVSQHLQKLRAAGIITAKRSGLEVTYRLASPTVEKLLDLLIAADSLSEAN